LPGGSGWTGQKQIDIGSYASDGSNPRGCDADVR
jgi:hypothetical protein